MRLDCLEVHRDGLVLAAAVIVDKGVSQNGQQPALGVGTGAVLLPRAVGLEHGVLHQILGLARIRGQPEGNAIERIQVRKCLVIEGTSRGSRFDHREAI
jgi:hypothetical protein